MLQSKTDLDPKHYTGHWIHSNTHGFSRDMVPWNKSVNNDTVPLVSGKTQWSGWRSFPPEWQSWFSQVYVSNNGELEILVRVLYFWNWSAGNFLTWWNLVKSENTIKVSGTWEGPLIWSRRCLSDKAITLHMDSVQEQWLSGLTHYPQGTSLFS